MFKLFHFGRGGESFYKSCIFQLLGQLACVLCRRGGEHWRGGGGPGDIGIVGAVWAHNGSRASWSSCVQSVSVARGGRCSAEHC